MKLDLGAPNGFNNLASVKVENIISALIKLVLIVAAVSFFFMLVLGGIKWITSGGDKAKTEGARNQITAALIGLVVVFSAWAILQLVNTFFGVDILSGLALPSFINPQGQTQSGGVLQPRMIPQ